MTQKEVATRIGVASQTYANYEQGRRDPDYQTLIKIADLFSVSVETILPTKAQNRSQNPLSRALLSVKPIPILGHIHAGQPFDSQSDIEGITYIAGDVPGDFALIVEGDCMEPQLTDGDLVICQRTNGIKAEANQIVVALIEGEVCIRRLRFVNEHWVLHASNPTYPDILLQPMDVIQGIVLQVTRKVESENTRVPNLFDGLSSDQQTAVMNLIRAFQTPNE